MIRGDGKGGGGGQRKSVGLQSLCLEVSLLTSCSNIMQVSPKVWEHAPISVINSTSGPSSLSLSVAEQAAQQ